MIENANVEKVEDQLVRTCDAHELFSASFSKSETQNSFRILFESKEWSS